MGWTGTSTDVDTVSNSDEYLFTGYLMKTGSTNSGGNVLNGSNGFQDGTLTQLQVRVTTASTGNFTVTINHLGTSNNTVSISLNTTGLTIDNTHSDTVSSNPNINVVLGGSPSSGLIISLVGFTFQATTAGKTVSRLGFYGNNNNPYTFNTNYFTGLGYSNTANTTEANAKMRMRKSFTIKNLGGATSSGFDTTFTMSSRKNGAAGNLTATSTSAIPSPFSDTSHSDSVVSGDDWNFQYKDTGVSFAAIFAMVDLISTNGDCPFFASNDATKSISTAVTNYFGLNGSLVTGDTTEAHTQVQVNSAFVFTNLLINCITNGNTGTSTFNLRANGSNVMSVSIGGTTGIHLDSTDSYTASTTDLMNYQLVTGSTGSAMTISQMSVNGNITTAVAGGPTYQHFGTNSAIVGAQYYQSFGSQMVVFGY